MFNEEQRIDNLVRTTYDYAVKICELKQENCELKQQIIELKNSAKDTNVSTKKRKRKLRAMTNVEFCTTYACDENIDCEDCSLYRQADVCELTDDWNLIVKNPYKTKDGKYIFIEVKE